MSVVALERIGDERHTEPVVGLPLTSPLPSLPLVPTIFHEPWWLDCVSGGRYREARVLSGERTVGRLPYVASRRFGLSVVEMPMFTHFLGPAIDDGAGNEPNRYLTRHSLTKALIRQLPRADHVYIKHHRGVTDTLAFGELGFLSEVQFTREIAPASHDELWSCMRDKTRNVIRRAEERFRIDVLTDADEFARFYHGNLDERGIASFYDRELCARLIDACLQRGVGRILGARERDGVTKAAIFTVWDGSVEYYLLSTRSGASGNGAVSLLVWNAMQHAASNGLTFDFDGVRSAGDTKFFSGFGGTMTPRFVSYLNSRTYKVMQKVWPTRRA